MQIKVRQKRNVIILDISGSVNVDAGQLVEMVSRCLHDGYTDILCNLEEVTSLDYMGVSVLVIAFKQVVNHNGRMKLVNVPTHLRTILDVAGIDKSIEIFSNEDEALKSYTSDRAIDKIKKLPLRRRFKRLPVGIKGTICRPSETEGCKVSVLNISAIGAYVYGCKDFTLQDEVILTLKLSSSKEELALEAKVVWLPDNDVQHRVSPGMGIEFHAISNEHQQQLIAFIDRNLSSIREE